MYSSQLPVILLWLWPKLLSCMHQATSELRQAYLQSSAQNTDLFNLVNGSYLLDESKALLSDLLFKQVVFNEIATKQENLSFSKSFLKEKQDDLERIGQGLKGGESQYYSAFNQEHYGHVRPESFLGSTTAEEILDWTKLCRSIYHVTKDPNDFSKRIPVVPEDAAVMEGFKRHANFLLQQIPTFASFEVLELLLRNGNEFSGAILYERATRHILVVIQGSKSWTDWAQGAKVFKTNTLLESWFSSFVGYFASYYYMTSNSPYSSTLNLPSVPSETVLCTPHNAEPVNVDELPPNELTVTSPEACALEKMADSEQDIPITVGANTLNSDGPNANVNMLSSSEAKIGGAKGKGPETDSDMSLADEKAESSKQSNNLNDSSLKDTAEVAPDCRDEESEATQGNAPLSSTSSQCSDDLNRGGVGSSDTDFNGICTDDKGLGTGLFIHRGFYNLVEAHLNDIKETVLRVVHEDSSNSPLKLSFAGHSLGGAMACLLAYHFKTVLFSGTPLEDSLKIQVFSCASPRLFSYDSALQVENVLGRDMILRIWNAWDFFTAIPPGRSFGFKHVGTDVKVNSEYHSVHATLNLKAYHQMDSYVESIKKEYPTFRSNLQTALTIRPLRDKIEELQQQILQQEDEIVGLKAKLFDYPSTFSVELLQTVHQDISLELEAVKSINGIETLEEYFNLLQRAQRILQPNLPTSGDAEAQGSQLVVPKALSPTVNDVPSPLSSACFSQDCQNSNWLSFLSRYPFSNSEIPLTPIDVGSSPAQETKSLILISSEAEVSVESIYSNQLENESVPSASDAEIAVAPTQTSAIDPAPVSSSRSETVPSSWLAYIIPGYK